MAWSMDPILSISDNGLEKARVPDSIHEFVLRWGLPIFYLPKRTAEAEKRRRPSETIWWDCMFWVKLLLIMMISILRIVCVIG